MEEVHNGRFHCGGAALFHHYDCAPEDKGIKEEQIGLIVDLFSSAGLPGSESGWKRDDSNRKPNESCLGAVDIA